MSNGVVAPVDLGASPRIPRRRDRGFTYEEQIYGVPYATENIALIRNTDLVPEAPATFEEMRRSPRCKADRR